MSETSTRDGSKRVELFVPIEFLKQKIEAITIKPVKVDHVVRWQAHEIGSILALLSELSGLQQAALRQLNYFDFDRVWSAFVPMLPAQIAKDIANEERPFAGEPSVPLSPIQQAALDEEPAHDEEAEPAPTPEPAPPGLPRRGRKLTALPVDDEQPRENTGFNVGHA